MAHTWVQIPVAIVCSLIYVAVLLADKWEKPVLYLPFLIVVGFGLILMIVEIVAFIVLIFLPPEFLKELFNHSTVASSISTSTISPEGSTNRTIFIVTLTVTITILIISELIGLYCWNVVRRARTYMLEEVTSGKVQRNCAIIGCDIPDGFSKV